MGYCQKEIDYGGEQFTFGFRRSKKILLMMVKNILPAEKYSEFFLQSNYRGEYSILQIIIENIPLQLFCNFKTHKIFFLWKS